MIFFNHCSEDIASPELDVWRILMDEELMSESF